MSFLGEHNVSLDVKGRFLLPTEIKKDFNIDASVENIFVVKRGMEECLELIHVERWKKIQEELKTLSSFDAEAARFKRRYVSGWKEVGLDSVGRILLPKELIEYAKLKKDVILASMGTEIEIWDKETYHKAVFENYSAKEFGELAKKFMGDKNL